MDRAQFMKQLERLLSDISEAEKQEALAYYNSYFDEAGPENEASVIRELGSPGKVAAIIKADLDESNEEYAQYTENGYEDLRENKASYMPEIRQRDGKHAGKTDRIHRGYRPKEKGSNSRFILILIALVFLSPFIITAASGVFSILLVVILFPFLAIFVSGVVAFAFIVAACACISVGVGILVTNTAVGLLVMGIGCLLFASGILFCILTGWLGSTIFPWILRKVTDFSRKSCIGIRRRSRHEKRNKGNADCSRCFRSGRNWFMYRWNFCSSSGNRRKCV